MVASMASTASFNTGQLLGAEPGAASRLNCAPRVVDALRHALRCGWRMEQRCRSHGVAKFAANALGRARRGAGRA